MKNIHELCDKGDLWAMDEQLISQSDGNERH